MKSTTEFFADFQYDAFSEFVDAELSEMFCDTTTQDENFEFDDIPF